MVYHRALLSDKKALGWQFDKALLDKMKLEGEYVGRIHNGKIFPLAAFLPAVPITFTTIEKDMYWDLPTLQAKLGMLQGAEEFNRRVEFLESQKNIVGVAAGWTLTRLLPYLIGYFLITKRNRR